jgi:phenylacetate-CoA ligase
MEEAGMDSRSSSLKVGVLGAEPWTNQMRQELEDRLDIDALDIYGLSEVMGPGVGNECIESKDGPHLWEDQFLPEIIDENGSALPDGERGELVFTTLVREAMPVIRYRTRDLTRLLPGTARPNMRRMEKVTGRNDDMIILRGVNLFPTQIEEIVLGIGSLSPHFVLEMRRAGHLDELTVRVERRDGSDEAEGVAGGRELTHRVKTLIGCSVQVAVVAPRSLERSAGKLKRLYDLRD